MSVAPEGRLVEARFVERPNRFVVHAQAEGALIKAHCPNPGRLEEFLFKGTPYLLRERPDARPDQTTTHSLVAAIDGRFHVDSDLAYGQAPPAGERSFEDGVWVVLDTQMANRLVVQALDEGALVDAFGAVTSYRTEPPAEHGRFDLAIDTDDGTVLVEVKSATLIDSDGSTALFPDAPTTRGTRHLTELTRRAARGEPVALAFVAMREDAERVRANPSRDPAFARALERAHEAGVRLLAWRIRFDGETMALADRIPVHPEPSP